MNGVGRGRGRRACGGAGPGRAGVGALISLLSAGSILDLSAGARRLDRGAGATMPVTGKTFRRRRADSESEDDEQDSEEVRCVWGGLPRGRKREAAYGDSPPARHLFDNIANYEPGCYPLLRRN